MRVRSALRALRVDLSKTLLSRWFPAAALATLFSLWLSVSRQLPNIPDMLRYGYEPDWSGLMAQAMQGSFAALSLPALSALPAAALALAEIQTGAARCAIFRSGWRPYVLSKALSVLLCGMAVQAGALLALTLALHGIRLATLGTPVPPAELAEALSPGLARVLCGGIWAGAGSLLALVSQTGSAATVGPLCLCYALMMVGTRFFPGVPALNALNWLTGFAPWQVLLLALLGVSHCALHRRKAAQYV